MICRSRRLRLRCWGAMDGNLAPAGNVVNEKVRKKTHLSIELRNQAVEANCC